MTGASHHPAPHTPVLSRRRLAQYTAAAAAATALTARAPAAGAAPRQAAMAGTLPQLAPLPAGTPRRTDIAPAEQRLASYLATLPDLANSVEDNDPDTYGYITGGWWRDWPNTFNARVQENVLTLAWFHRHQRPWNPYANSPALLARLDAALGHYLKLQFPDGSWPEYYASEHSRPTTGFAITFLTSTLGHLEATKALPQTRRQLTAALRRAIDWFLDPSNTMVWGPHIPYTNHIATGLLGTAQFLALHPDRAMRRHLDDRIDALASTGLSPAGYFYEESGTDVSYSLNVMSPDLAALYELTKNKNVRSLQATHLDWLSHNMVREPDGTGWFCNVAPSSRTSTNYLDDAPLEEERSNLNRLWAQHLPAMAAYLPTTADKDTERRLWAQTDAPVAPLGRGKVSPAALRDADYPDRHPSAQTKKEAIDRAPYLNSRAYVEYRSDPLGQDYLFVRRPGYYAGSHYGRRATDRVRNGLSFWWHPKAGMVIHSLNNTDDACWTTRIEAGTVDRLEARSTLRFEYLRGEPGTGERIQDPATVTGQDLLSVSYTAVGDVIRKQVTHEPRQLRVHVEATEPFTERIPLILRADDILAFEGSSERPRFATSTHATATGLIIRRGATEIYVRWGTSQNVALTPLPTKYFRDASRHQHALSLPAQTSLTYRIGT